jgi:hypothetical protein
VSTERTAVAAADAPSQVPKIAITTSSRVRGAGVGPVTGSRTLPDDPGGGRSAGDQEAGAGSGIAAPVAASRARMRAAC